MSQNSTKPDVELVYPEPIELLDESEPIRENETSNSIFAKKINEIIRKQK